MYGINFREFANWYAKFCGYVDAFDKKVNRLTEMDLMGLQLEITKINNRLKRECDKLEGLLPEFSLRSFRPSTGDEFDPYYHEQEEEFDDCDSFRIVLCKRPGVKQIHAGSISETVLVKAEVEVEQADDINDL